MNIALLAGDGIGPEVIDQAVKVSNAIAEKFGHQINWTPALTGAAAIDAVGDPTPTKHMPYVKRLMQYFLAQLVTALRQRPFRQSTSRAGLVTNAQKTRAIRQCSPYLYLSFTLDKSPLKQERIEGTDLVFLRELTGGIYFGEQGRKDDGNTAFDTCTYTRDEIIRLAKKASSWP